MATEIQTHMTPTLHKCWKCSAALWHLTPAVHGWSWYCEVCEHLTSPRAELDAAMRSKSPDACGIVAAVPCKIEIVK